jgi:hypothetical protein
VLQTRAHSDEFFHPENLREIQAHPEGECRMFSKKLLLVLALTMFSGTVAGTMTATKKICIPCTGYCKTHPNAPQCN